MILLAIVKLMECEPGAAGICPYYSSIKHARIKTLKGKTAEGLREEVNSC